MPFIDGKLIQPKSLCPGGDSEKMELTYSGYKQILPFVKNHFRDFNMQAIMDMEIEDYNKIPGIHDAQTNDVIEGTGDARVNKTKVRRIQNYGYMQELLLQRIQLTVPIEFLPELESFTNGFKAWNMLKNHLTEANDAFLTAVKQRIRDRKLSDYGGNMRRMLLDFENDFDLLAGHENLSPHSKLTLIRKSQCKDPKLEWTKEDPYHEPFSMVIHKMNTTTKTDAWIWKHLKKSLNAHYDLIYKNEVEKINATKNTNTQQLNLTDTQPIQNALSAKAMIQQLSQTPGISKTKKRQLEASAYYMGNNTPMKGKGKGGKGLGNNYKGYKGYKGGKGNHKGKGGKGYKGFGNQGKGGKGKGNGECFKCGKKGHYARDCWSNTNANQSNSNNVGNNENDNVPEHAFVATFSMETLGIALSASMETQDMEYFYVDTCATSHMTGTQNGMSESKPCKGSIIFGDPMQTSEVTAMCKKSFYVKDQDSQKHKLSIKDFMFVPGLTKTLLSVKKLNDSGIQLIMQSNNLRLVLPKTQSRGAVYLPLEWKNGLLAIKIVDFV